MGMCYRGPLLLLWIMILVPATLSQFIAVEENKKDVVIFNQTFTLPPTCDVNTIEEIDQGHGKLLNWTKPVQKTPGQYSMEVSLIKALDAEKDDIVEVRLQVNYQCNDGTSNQKTLPKWSITLINVMDEKPVFTQDQYKAIVPENQPVNTTIVYNITAIDPDGDTAITYSMKTSDNDGAMFTGVSSLKLIDGRNRFVFDIILSQPLDYEQTMGYSFTVTATDSVNMSCTTDVVIQVVDVQDKPPSFTLSIYSGRVTEMAAEGTSVTRVSAIDGDQTEIRNQVAYSIVKGPVDMFEMNNMTGVISTKGQLDVDGANAIGSNGLVILTVQATELNSSGEVQYGETTAKAQVQIQIEDSNDHPPVFSSPTYSGSIRGEAVAGEIVSIDGGGYISVTDQDQAASNNHFSLHIERDGKPWSVFEPNVQSQFVQASVLVVLKEPDALDGLRNTHIRFQLIAKDLSSSISKTNSNMTSVADIIVFVMPHATTVPPAEAIVDLPLSTSDVIVFVMGFLLLLNIILTVIICRLMHRNGQGGLGLFRRNSKYYVSGRKRSDESGGVQRLDGLANRNASGNDIQSQTTSNVYANAKPSDTLALTDAAVNRSTEIRNTVSSAANRNRCDVTLLSETVAGQPTTATTSTMNGVAGQRAENRNDQTKQTNSYDVTPLKSEDVRKKSSDQPNSSESDRSKDLVPTTSSILRNGTNKCDVIPLETALASKNKTLSNLLERVQQKLTPSEKDRSETCDLRPLHENNSSPDASFTDVTNSNNSSFSEKHKCDVAPLIKTSGKSTTDKRIKQTSPSEVNVAFVPDDTEVKTLKFSDGVKHTPQKPEDKPNESKDPISNGVTLLSDDGKDSTTVQFIPTLSLSQSQITQTGVPPVALALPFGSSSKPVSESSKTKAVINPVYREENVLTKPDTSVHNPDRKSNERNQTAPSPQQLNNKLSQAQGGSSNGKGIQQNPSTDTKSKDYVEAAKTLLNSATLKKIKENEKEKN